MGGQGVAFVEANCHSLTFSTRRYYRKTLLIMSMSLCYVIKIVKVIKSIYELKPSSGDIASSEDIARLQHRNDKMTCSLLGILDY